MTASRARPGEAQLLLKAGSALPERDARCRCQPPSRHAGPRRPRSTWARCRPQTRTSWPGDSADAGPVAGYGQGNRLPAAWHHALPSVRLPPRPPPTLTQPGETGPWVPPPLLAAHPRTPGPPSPHEGHAWPPATKPSWPRCASQGSKRAWGGGVSAGHRDPPGATGTPGHPRPPPGRVGGGGVISSGTRTLTHLQGGPGCPHTSTSQLTHHRPPLPNSCLGQLL